jgi:hypothetical protein
MLWLALRAYAALRPRRCVGKILGGLCLVTRWFLSSRPAPGRTGAPGWYLHRIERPDDDRAEHNHPWSWARVWILRGGYLESRNGVMVERHAGDSFWIYPHEYHRIVLVSPDTWTLFHAGPKHGQGWGFRGDDEEPTLRSPAPIGRSRIVWDTTLPPMTPAQCDEQMRSFVTGNVGLHNPLVTREVVDTAAALLARVPRTCLFCPVDIPDDRTSLACDACLAERGLS